MTIIVKCPKCGNEIVVVIVEKPVTEKPKRWKLNSPIN